MTPFGTLNGVNFEPILTLIRIPVRARAYNDLHQHPGCVKNSIKMGSILMLVLTAPESGSMDPDLMLVLTHPF